MACQLRAVDADLRAKSGKRQLLKVSRYGLADSVRLTPVSARQTTNEWSNTGIIIKHAMRVILRYTALEDDNGLIDNPVMHEVEHKFKARMASVYFSLAVRDKAYKCPPQCDCSVENLECALLLLRFRPS